MLNRPESQGRDLYGGCHVLHCLLREWAEPEVEDEPEKQLKINGEHQERVPPASRQPAVPGCGWTRCIESRRDGKEKSDPPHPRVDRQDDAVHRVQLPSLKS